jgi:Fe-S-cluster containining protein
MMRFCPKLCVPCELCLPRRCVASYWGERQFYSIKHKINQFINKNTTLLSKKISKKCIFLKKSSESVTVSDKTIVYHDPKQGE